MGRWTLRTGIACLLLALTAGPAAGSKRGKPRSDERVNYCARRHIDCAKQALEECRNNYQTAEEIDRCDRNKIEVCNKAWGRDSDCHTRAKDGADPTLPTRPGNTESQPSRTPSRVAPPPQEQTR